MALDEQEKIEYTLKRSARARRVRIAVSCEGKVIVTIPKITNYGLRITNENSIEKIAEKFVAEKIDWIKKTLVRFSGRPAWEQRKYSRRDYLDNKEKARELVLDRLVFFMSQYNNLEVRPPSWKRVAIRDTRSRWGSCSRQGNLNFSYKIIFLPAHLQDYIIVHELCHLKELNHSKRFWALVARVIPEYNERRRELRGKTSSK